MGRSKIPFGLAEWLAYERAHPGQCEIVARCELCGRAYVSFKSGAHCIDSRCQGGIIKPIHGIAATAK